MTRALLGVLLWLCMCAFGCAQIPVTGAGLAIPAASGPTTIFTSPLAGASDPGWAGFSIAEVLPTTGNSSGHVQVSFTTSSAGGANISNVYYCIAATPPNCAATPVQVTFGGHANFTVASSTTVVSDWVGFAPAGTTIIVCIDAATSPGTTYLQGAATGASLFYSSGAPLCSSATRTGWTSYTANTTESIGLIQTEP